MPSRDLSYLVLSDVHLFHAKTKTSEIIDHLDEFFHHFSPQSPYVNLDIIFIAGDLFDQLSDFANSEITLVSLWLSRLITFCSTYNIKLRVLEGTPSHDWHQSRIIGAVVEMTGKPIDYRYIETLYIEHIADLDLRVLYVPDEWTANTDLTFSQVQELLREQGIYEVDIAIMHGCFAFQLKGIPGHIQHHKESNYLSIVKYYISIGHFHTYSHYDRIIAQGSFDRIAHNEEGPKGATLIRLKVAGEAYFDFIENALAKIYKTIEFRSYDVDKCKEKLHKLLKKLPVDSYVRLRAAKDHPMYVGLDSVKLMYPQFNFSRITIDKEDRSYQLINTVETPIEYTPISITRENISSLLMTSIESRYTLTQSQLTLLSQILDQTHKGDK